MSRFLLIGLALMLNGCVVYHTPHAKIWLLCYQNDYVLANGMYQNNQLDLRCNKRSQIQFQYKPGIYENHALEDGMKKYVDEHK